MRVINLLASVALLGMGAAVLPSGASALSCVRPWAYELDGARMALTEGFGAGDFDGFLIATVTSTTRGQSGRVSDLELEVSVAFDADVPRDMQLEVGPHGPLAAFLAGHAYFLTLHEVTDSTLPPLFVHPCGPAFEVSSSNDLNLLLGLRDDETVVDGGYLSDLRQSFSRFPVPPLAVVGATLALVVAAGVFLMPWRRSSAKDS